MEPITLLEDIETGSLRVWLRNILTSIDDESLQSGEWKKVVGIFLVKAKRIMIDWTEQRTEVTSEEDLKALQKSILDEAAKTGVLRIPMYAPVPTSQIAKSVELIANATTTLKTGESVTYLAETEAPATLNPSFQVVPDSLTELLVHKQFVSDAPMILIIKKPDFLGDLKWEFRHGKTAFPARMSDAQWMLEFRTGKKLIQPGDALQATVRSTTRYGYDGEVVDFEHDVVRVDDVIQAVRPSQDSLFLRGE